MLLDILTLLALLTPLLAVFGIIATGTKRTDR